MRTLTRSSCIPVHIFQIITTIGKLPDKTSAVARIINDQLAQGVKGGVLTLLEADKFSPYPLSNDWQSEELKTPMMNRNTIIQIHSS